MTPSRRNITPRLMKPELDRFRPQFSSAQVCAVAGIDTDTLKNWVSREKPRVVFLSGAERKKIGGRTTIEYSFARVMQITITAELVRLGLPPRRAALLAGSFTDLEDGPLPGRPDRGRCELFKTGKTLMVALVGNDCAQIVNFRDGMAWSELENSVGFDFLSAVILDLTKIDSRVRAALAKSD